MKSLLRSITLFEKLGDDDLEIISRYCRYKTFKAGEVLFYEGDNADCLYIVLSGEVEVWADFKQKDRDLLALTRKGDIVGEMALLDDLPRSATLIARSDTDTYSINNEDFSNLLQQCPSVALLIIKSISAIVRNSNQNFVATLRQRNKDLEKTYKELIETQKRLSREENLSTLGKFASMILHDIKNPISVIKSYSDLALMRYGDTLGELDKYFKQITKEAKRLNSLANELLDFSRGEVSLNLSLVKPSELVQEVVDEVDAIIQARSLKVSWSFDWDMELLLDKDRIQRVMHNILDNARKALSVGGEIEISTRLEKSLVLIEVRDNGSGMSKEVLSHVFEPFFTQSEKGGTGLGMMIAKNIMEAHKGTIRVDSEENKGTSVTLCFPYTI